MKYIHDFELIKKTHLNDLHFVLELKAPKKLPLIQPGQFVQVKVDKTSTVFLRRPFSVHNIDYVENSLSLFIKIVGEGTNCLANLGADESLNIIYPLGKGFNIKKVSKALLVGGGCGIAPLLYLAKCLKQKDVKQDIILGARTADDLFLSEEYAIYGDLFTITDDGSEGEKGFVTDHSLFKTDKPDYDRIYVCGPEPMLKVVAKIAKQKNIDCEVSLENTMACGYGACLCCVTDTVEGNKCVCTEGPVFNINQLKWEH